MTIQNLFCRMKLVDERRKYGYNSKKCDKKHAISYSNIHIGIQENDFKGDITFGNVNFAYKDKSVLNNFGALNGKVTNIVGASESDKTTLTNLFL